VSGEFELSGWVTATLSDLCTRIVDGSHNPPSALTEGLPMLSAKNINDGRIDFNGRLIAPEAFEQEDRRTRVRPGDVLLTIVGSIGRAAVVPAGAEPLALQRSVAVLKSVISPRFLAHQLQAPDIQRVLEAEARGTAQKGIYLKRLGLVPVRVPPAAEQDRIADALDELLSDLDAGVVALEHVRTKLARYRAAVLKAAVEGSLTSEWRQQHPNVEPATELLTRILAERRHRWEEQQLRKSAEKGQVPPKNWKEKYKEPSSSGDNLQELPPGWCWAALDQIADIQGGVTKGQKFSASDQTRVVPYLRVANVQRGFLNLSVMKEIQALESDIKALRLLPGDVLFNEGGDRDKLGRGWIWEGQLPECIHQNHVFRARVCLPEVQPKFVSWCGNSYGQLWFMKAGKQSVNLASINLTVLRSFPLPLPPAREQEAIIEAVEDHLSVIEHIESEIDDKVAQADALKQSILRYAFTGQLVPQDPNDEPASELLKRIAAERDARAQQAAAAKCPVRAPKTKTRKVT
jgi:type I restriction enzyme S subunit